MNNKYYYYTDGTVPLNRSINNYLTKRKDDKNLQFVIVADKDFFINKSFKHNFESLYENLQSNSIQPHNIQIALKDNQRRFHKDEWNLFKQFNTYFDKKGIKFGFEDMERVWSVKEVENANNNIVKTADEIRKHNFSPYEQLMMAYLKVTARTYTKEINGEHFSESRSVYGVLNSDRIVCVGYAELLKAIMGEIGCENIKIYSNDVECSTNGKVLTGAHRNLIIHIKDEKYGINGFYYLDPTWDCGHKNKTLPQLAYFLVPLCDIDKIKTQIRGIWCGLPVSQKRKDEIKERKKTSVKAYNYNRKANVSFTSDGFSTTNSFLSDCITMYPELANIIKKEVNAEMYENWTPYYDSLQSKSEIYKQILNVIEENNFLVASYRDYSNFERVVNNCVDNNNLEEFNQFIAKIQDDSKVNACENLIGKIEEEFYNCDDYGSYAYYSKTIEEIKDMLTYERYEKFINDWVEQYKQNFPTITTEEARESLIENMSYEQYLEGNEFQRNMLKEYQSNIYIQNKNLTRFCEEIRREFKNNLRFADCIKCINDLDKYEIVKHLFETYESTDEIMNKIQSYIESTKVYSIKNFLNNKILEVENEKSKVIDILQSVENSSISKIINKFVEEHRGRAEVVTEWFKSQSKSVDMHKTSAALKTILLKTHTELSEQETYDLTSNIINATCGIINDKYKNTAVNAFMQNSIQSDRN